MLHEVCGSTYLRLDSISIHTYEPDYTALRLTHSLVNAVYTVPVSITGNVRRIAARKQARQFVWLWTRVDGLPSFVVSQHEQVRQADRNKSGARSPFVAG